jgi:hypothetical protein
MKKLKQFLFIYITLLLQSVLQVLTKSFLTMTQEQEQEQEQEEQQEYSICMEQDPNISIGGINLNINFNFVSEGRFERINWNLLTPNL